MRFLCLLAVLAISLVFTNTTSSAPVSEEDERLSNAQVCFSDYVSKSKASSSRVTEIVEIGTTSSQPGKELPNKTGKVNFSSLITVKPAAKLIEYATWWRVAFLKQCEDGNENAVVTSQYVDLQARIAGLQKAFNEGKFRLLVKLLSAKTFKGPFNLEEAKKFLLEFFLERGGSRDDYFVELILEQGFNDWWMAKEVEERLFIQACKTEEKNLLPYAIPACRQKDFRYFQALYKKVNPMTRTQGLFHALERNNVLFVKLLLQYGEFNDDFKSVIEDIMKELFLKDCKAGENQFFSDLLDKVAPETLTEGFFMVRPPVDKVASETRGKGKGLLMVRPSAVRPECKELEMSLLMHGKFSNPEMPEIIEAYKERYREACISMDQDTIWTLHKNVDKETRIEGHKLVCSEKSSSVCEIFYKICEREHKKRFDQMMQDAIANQKIQGECSWWKKATESKLAKKSSWFERIFLGRSRRVRGSFPV